jgi:prepilin-type N-terminal cleavage/methylation domain-containing protein
MNARARGFTLVEMLVVVLLSSIVMGSIYQMVVMQDRTTREQHAVIETQQNARTALAVMTSDMKELSAVDGDITGATETSINFRALRKAGIACEISPVWDWLEVRSLGQAFAAGDSVLIYAEGANANSIADDTWVRLVVFAVAPASQCGADPFGAPSTQRLSFIGLLPLSNVRIGALVRSFIPTRYRILNNGEWGQLMRQEALPPAFTPVETAIIDKLAATADGGLSLRYFNAAGASMAYGTLAANLANIMTVQVKVRGKAVATVKSTGVNRFQDSLVTNVYMRGNYRTQ